MSLISENVDHFKRGQSPKTAMGLGALIKLTLKDPKRPIDWPLHVADKEFDPLMTSIGIIDRQGDPIVFIPATSAGDANLSQDDMEEFIRAMVDALNQKMGY